MGRMGPRKTQAPSPFPGPAPLKGLGRVVLFGIAGPCHLLGPRPTHHDTPGAFLLRTGGNKRDAFQGMSAGGPHTGVGRALPERCPPGPV